MHPTAALLRARTGWAPTYPLATTLSDILTEWRGIVASESP